MNEDIEELARLLPAPVEADLAPDRHRLLKEHMMQEIQETVPTGPRRRVLKWAFAGAVPVMAAATALVLIGGQPTTTTPPEPKSPREVLLAAATNVRKTTSTGRYFVTKTETGYVFPARGYDVLGRRYTEDWEPRSAQDRPWGVMQHLGAAPFGPGSEAAWHVDGSPTVWTIPGDNKNPEATTVTAAAGPRTNFGRVMVQYKNGGSTNVARTFVLGGKVMSAETMAALPTDAAGLRAWLTERYNADPDPSISHRDRLIDDALHLIADLPVTAQVRSAAYRMLAELDTSQLLPNATDQHGRTGSAVTFPVKYEDGVTTLRVIFNEHSGDVLSIEQLTAAGKLRGYTLMVSSGWTDEQPPAG